MEQSYNNCRSYANQWGYTLNNIKLNKKEIIIILVYKFFYLHV